MAVQVTRRTSAAFHAPEPGWLLNVSYQSRKVSAQSGRVAHRMEGLFGSANRFCYAMSLLGIQETGTFLLERFAPRRLAQTSLWAMQQSAEVMKLMSSPDGQVGWDELRNKLQAFSLFAYSDSVANSTAGPASVLTDLIRKASHLGPYRAVWATEGIGHHYADLKLSHTKRCEALLCDDSASRLPPESLVPLHAGMGLAFAEYVFDTAVQERACDSHSLLAFLKLCEGNARSEYFGASYEALGLVIRNLHPHLVAAVDSDLTLFGEELLPYFWHGVGRAIYFAPTNFLPYRSAPWKAWAMCMTEPPHALGRRNAVAGLAWALTLVNIQQPEIMATFLKHHGRQMEESDAFANGVCSAAIIWLHSTASSDDLTAFHDYKPDSSLAELWKIYVEQTFESALRHYKAANTSNSLGQLFRYQPSTRRYSGD